MSASAKIEAACEAAWTAWDGALARYEDTHRVFGVALHSSGETFYQLGAQREIQVVCDGGYAYTKASAGELHLLDNAMARGHFMVCVQKRGMDLRAPISRVWPGDHPDWSRKTLHPDLGGLGLPGIVLRS